MPLPSPAIPPVLNIVAAPAVARPWWARLRHPRAQAHLAQALDAGSLERVVLALQQGAHLNPGPEQGEPALLDATRAGDVGLVTLLLDQGVSIEARDPGQGQTPLLIAVQEDHPAVITLLVQRGANLDHVDDRDNDVQSLAANLKPVVGTWPQRNTPMLKHLDAMRQLRLEQERNALHAVFDETTGASPSPVRVRGRL